MRNEYAKKKRNVPRKAPEFVLLDNMSNRMNQIEKRICSLQQENKEIRESIMDLRIFLKQYKKFEIEFREKIKHMANEAQMHLDRAVQTYEEREEFMSKRDIYKDRCAQDLRKIAINENSLNLILENTKDFEEFGTLQKQERSDSRIAITGDLIEQGVTGLEPALNKVQKLHSAIVASSGKETPKEMEDHFKLTDHQANSMFSYLEELLKMVHHTQYIIDDVRDKNQSLLINLSDQERRLRWEIKEMKDTVEQSQSEADAAMVSKDQARGELNELLQKVHSLYLKCTSDMKAKLSTDQKDEEEADESLGSEKEETIDTLQDKEIDDSNAVDFNENFERKVLELLTLLEYIRMKVSFVHMHSAVF
ncbi:uncharacterized protein TNCT_137931 [Trichonephila clavata]|uniref:ODAD1 central coiled coil region domain-containing protein n=1 Tax=Trichonephila clavata TaxID=2740835 RepID=A0A8X6L9T0_TRICU|nr:uncharacterized protein TNCT_137931 [Trichonephila clavata]